MIKCELCGEDFKTLTRNHLYTHGYSLETYLSEFPGAKIKGKLAARGEETKLKHREVHARRSDEEKAVINEKIKTTNRNRYGVDHSSQTVAVKAKIEDTNLSRYGTKAPAQNDDVKAKIKQTWAENYEFGFPQRDATVRAKVAQTNLERYGVTTTIDIARQAFYDNNDGLNPFQTKEVKEKIRERFFHESGVYHNKQRHIAADVLAIMRDASQLQALIDTAPIQKVANDLGVCSTTVARRCRELGVIRPSSSSVENAVSDFLRHLGLEFLERSRKVIAPLELDFVIPSQKIAVEVCGIYWHSDLFLPPSYHLDKLKKCEEKGFRLITLFEDEIVHNLPLVKTRLAHILRNGERGVSARKLSIRRIPRIVAKDFLNQHHIQGGSRNSGICIGAYDANQLVAVMSFKQSWRVNGATELDRFATDRRSHAGVASRMFSYFCRDMAPEWIVSYADRRWSSGDLYRTLGFSQTKVSQPSYTYVRNTIERHDKSKFRKSKISSLVENGDEKTEQQIMKELGYYRVYDCGSIRFDWRKK